MTMLDFIQIIFISLVFIIGVGGMIKVIFFDKEK